MSTVRGGAGVVAGARSLLALAVGSAVLAEVMRVSFPLLYDFASQIGFLTAAWVIPLLFAIPLLLAPIVGLVPVWAVATLGLAGLAVARAILQVQPSPGLAVALAGTLLGLVAVPAAWRRVASAHGAPAAAGAFFIGLALDTGIRVALTTWDAAWQSTPAAWMLGLGMPALLACLVAARPDDARVPPRVRSRAAAVPGPLLGVQALALANPAFVASSGQLSLPAAGALVLVGLAVAATAGRAGWVDRRWAWWAAAAALIVVVAATTGPSDVAGPAVWAGVLLGQWGAGTLAARSLVPESAATRADSAKSAVAAGAGILAMVAVLLAYQISYEIQLGVPQAWIAAAGAVVVAAVTWPASRPSDDAVEPGRTGRWPATRWAPVAVPAALLLVPVWSWLTWPAPPDEPVAGPAKVRMATFNVHSAVSWDGTLDPEGIAEVLRDGDVEVAMLQEVARGWPLAGGLDVAAWLARRTGLDVAYGPAADHQFGNAVLTAYPVVERWSGELDAGAGPMRRGYVGVSLATGDEPVHVWSTHLQHQDHSATRRAQAMQVIRAWRQRGQPDRTVVGGDFNSPPGSGELEPWFDGTGLVSAVDPAAGPAGFTAPADEPAHQIDWLLGTSEVEFDEVEIPATRASDHRPILATVTFEGTGD